MNAALAPSTYRTKQAVVYDRLRDAILSGELAAGERLIINDLAEWLQVSPSPIREAIQQMQAEGLVTLIPHVGAVVSPISAQQIPEVFTLLEGLEIVGNRIAAERMTDQDEEELRATLRDMSAAIDAGDTLRWTTLNRDFHMRVCQVADMPMLTEFTGKVFDRWQRVRLSFVPQIPAAHLQETQVEHEAILDAMVAREFAHLEALTREHNRRALDRYSAVLLSQSPPR